MTTQDDDHDLTDDELLTVPGEDIPPDRLAEFVTRRYGIVHQREIDELVLELSGESGRHGMIFSAQDPRVKHQREEEEYRRQQYEQAMREITGREDQLLMRIDEQEREIDKRRKEIDARAIKLHDGRRAYVDGDGYVDGQGTVLQGADDAEARRLRQQNPNASTAQEKDEADREWNEVDKLKHDIQQHSQDREQAGGSTDLKHEQETVSDYEKRDQRAAETRRAEIEAKPGSVADAYSTDYSRTTSYAKLQNGQGDTLAADFTPAAEGTQTPVNNKPDQAPPTAAPPAVRQV